MKAFLAVVAAAAFLAACTTSPEETSDTSGSGASTQQASGSDRSNVTSTAVGNPRAGTQEELNATIGDRVFFAFDSYALQPGARSTVEQWANWLKTNAALSVTIEGHADERGTREYNLALGERRAVAVKDYLGALGIDSARVGTISYGKERPAVLGSNEEAWAKNRRGVLVLN